VRKDPVELSLCFSRAPTQPIAVAEVQVGDGALGIEAKRAFEERLRLGRVAGLEEIRRELDPRGNQIRTTRDGPL